jgi:hypothetical protein
MNDVSLKRRKVTRYIPGDKKSSKDRAYAYEETYEMLAEIGSGEK